MGKARSAEWYDRTLYTAEEPLPLEQARPYYQILFQLGAEWILSRTPRAERVIDVGCGQALFADALTRRGYYGGYWGLDFSKDALRLATKRLATNPGIAHWSVSVHDLEEAQIAPVGQHKQEYYTCFETLEHLSGDHDQRFLSLLPEGAEIAFSVPTFDSECHERVFESPQAAIQRYGAVLEIDHAATRVIPVRHDRSIFFMTGRRRELRFLEIS